MGELTVISPSQPRCTGSADDPSVPLSQTNPTPHCPTATNATTTGPMGCFIQPYGLFCAPLASTRGFLYTAPDPNPTDGDAILAPRLSFPRPSSNTGNNNSTNNSTAPPSLPGFAHIGDSCTSIPLPTTDPSLLALITWTALASLDVAAHHSPLGLGQGADAANWFTYRSDCERGTYCDLANQADGNGTRVCREQLPNYHNCTSYMQCLSLRCDTLDAERSSVVIHPSDQTLISMDTAMGTCKSNNMNIEKRAVEHTVCLPRSYPRTGNNSTNSNGNDGTSNNTSNKAAGFRPWMGGLLGSIFVLGALVIFVVVQRRNRRENARKILMKEMERQAEANDGGLTGEEKFPPSGGGGRRTSMQEMRATRSFERLAGRRRFSLQNQQKRQKNQEPQRQESQRRQNGSPQMSTTLVFPPTADNNSSTQLLRSSNVASSAPQTPRLPYPSTPTDASPLESSTQQYQNHPSSTSTIPRVPTLTFQVPPPIITSPLPSQPSKTFDGDEALLMPHPLPISNSSRTSPSLSASSSLPSSTSSPRYASGSNQISSAPVSPISPISPGSPPPKIGEGYIDVSGPSTPAARWSQRVNHVHGLKPGPRKA